MKKCSIDTCNHPSRTRGFCSKHYQRWYRLGDPLAGGTYVGAPLEFLNEVILNHVGSECLEWPFHKDRAGYGRIRMGSKPKLVSRVVCTLVHGSPPTQDHQAAHICGKGHLACCSPHHVVWKTPAENNADKRHHGTLPLGERVGGSKLSATDVLTIRSLKGSDLNCNIAAQYGVNRQTVSDVLNGKTWSWL